MNTAIHCATKQWNVHLFTHHRSSYRSIRIMFCCLFVNMFFSFDLFFLRNYCAHWVCKSLKMIYDRASDVALSWSNVLLYFVREDSTHWTCTRKIQRKSKTFEISNNRMRFSFPFLLCMALNWVWKCSKTLRWKSDAFDALHVLNEWWLMDDW